MAERSLYADINELLQKAKAVQIKAQGLGMTGKVATELTKAVESLNIARKYAI